MNNEHYRPDMEEMEESGLSAKERRARREARRKHLRRKTVRKSSAARSLAAFAVIMLVIGAIVGVFGDKFSTYIKEKKEDRVAASVVTPEQERLEGIKRGFSEGRAVLEILRNYFPNDLVFISDGKYSFVERDDSLKKHDFNSEKVRKNSDGTWGYVDGDRKVVKGIDVSAHQGEIDWAKVAKTNVDFAIIRAMYRGYESGKLVEDKQFRRNIEEARAKGIKTGVYVFTQAINKTEVDEEVSMLNGLLGAYDIEYPVVVDVERVDGGDARMDKLDQATRTELVKYYCERIKESGYTPMIYFNINGALNMLDYKELEEYEKWFAVYDSDFYFPYKYSMWQYKDTGKVDGIDGRVDFDLYFPE